MVQGNNLNWTKRGGSWALYHSPDHNQEMLTIDWTAVGGTVKNTTYTYVLEKDKTGHGDPNNDTYLAYGHTENDSLFYDIHNYNKNKGEFEDLKILIHAENKGGRIKQTNWDAGAWHCWDTSFADTDCN
ncbi:MAG: hypothetical protein HC896_13320 [Bacteroidales bacterium]|nr:hypothetical protein [Bacteroidales bacterium]